MKNKYHHRINFPNGYSTSIVSHENSYGGEDGLFEIAVIYGESIVYDTPITGDVLGYLTFQAVASALEQIAALPVR